MDYLSDWTELGRFLSSIRMPSFILAAKCFHSRKSIPAELAMAKLSLSWNCVFFNVFLQTALSCFNNQRLLKVKCQTINPVVGALLEWFWAVAKGLCPPTFLPNNFKIEFRSWVLKHPFWACSYYQVGWIYAHLTSARQQSFGADLILETGWTIPILKKCAETNA